MFFQQSRLAPGGRQSGISWAFPGAGRARSRRAPGGHFADDPNCPPPGAEQELVLSAQQWGRVCGGDCSIAREGRFLAEELVVKTRSASSLGGSGTAPRPKAALEGPGGSGRKVPVLRSRGRWGAGLIAGRGWSLPFAGSRGEFDCDDAPFPFRSRRRASQAGDPMDVP